MEMDVGFCASVDFDALYESRVADEFLSSAVLQGGPGLAFPCWTVVPILYHTPPPYEIKLSVSKVPDQYEGFHTVQDRYGVTWRLDEGLLEENARIIEQVHSRACQALDGMKKLQYLEAVEALRCVSVELWPCHLNSPLGFWVNVHLAHALLRAAIYQCPSPHEARELLEESFQKFRECLEELQLSPRWHPFQRSLIFSSMLGLAWIYFFRGELKKAEAQIVSARRVVLDNAHLRADRDIDTIYLWIAYYRAVGDLEEQNKWLGKFGHRLSSYVEDIEHVGLLDMHVHMLQSKFFACVQYMTYHVLSAKPHVPLPGTKDDIAVIQLLEQMIAGFMGDVWFSLGGLKEARLAYRSAYKPDPASSPGASRSLLLRAAGLVGCGNVHTRFASSSLRVDRELALKKALRKYEKAGAIYTELGYKEGQAVVHSNLGCLYQQQQHVPKAMNHYSKARDLSVKTYKDAAAIQLNCQIAQLHIQQKEWKAAEDLLGVETEDKLAQAWVHHVKGVLFVGQGSAKEVGAGERGRLLDTAKHHLTVAVTHFAEIQTRLRFLHPLWLTMYEQQKETYGMLLWCVSHKGKKNISVVEALIWTERSRSRLLMYEHWETFASSVRSHISDSISAAADQLSLEVFDSLEVNEAWKALQLSLCSPHLEGCIIVEYAICGDQGLLTFVLDPESKLRKPKMVRTSFGDMDHLDRQALRALIAQTVDEIDERDPKQKEKTDKRLSFLYKVLIEPIQRHLRGNKQLIFIPHEELCRVPFSALLDSKGVHLIQRHAVSCVESLRSLVRCLLLRWRSDGLRALDPEQGSKSKALVVGIADHTGLNLATLMGAEEEAGQVHKVLRTDFGYKAATTLLKGSEATKSQICDLLSQTSEIVHLATHGIINSRHEEGAIVFFAKCDPARRLVRLAGATDWEPADVPVLRSATLDLEDSIRDYSAVAELEEEAILTAHVISKMQLQAQLVVLSACETGRGVILGEGVAGLGRALLKAGVPAAVLSLWPVRDDATSKLMQKFYKQLAQGLPVAVAMQQAMKAMISEKKLYGAWRVGQWAAFMPYGLATAPIRCQNRIPIPTSTSPSILWRALALTSLTVTLLFTAKKLALERRRG